MPSVESSVGSKSTTTPALGGGEATLFSHRVDRSRALRSSWISRLHLHSLRPSSSSSSSPPTPSPSACTIGRTVSTGESRTTTNISIHNDPDRRYLTFFPTEHPAPPVPPSIRRGGFLNDGFGPFQVRVSKSIPQNSGFPFIRGSAGPAAEAAGINGKMKLKSVAVEDNWDRDSSPLFKIRDRRKGLLGEWPFANICGASTSARNEICGGGGNCQDAADDTDIKCKTLINQPEKQNPADLDAQGEPFSYWNLGRFKRRAIISSCSPAVVATDNLDGKGNLNTVGFIPSKCRKLGPET